MVIEGTGTFNTLGRTGLRVSPLCLGVMTFGWGVDKAVSRQLFDLYRESGGNFFDTANAYGNGTSEAWLGEFIEETGTRDQVVVATKFSFTNDAGNPNGGGNGRKHIRRALEESLRRLRTDYVDLYILHAWDRTTPVEEVAATFNDLVRAGLIRHVGLSNVPAWYAARFATLADLRGWERPASLQLEYSLIARHLEREHLPMAQELGMSLTPWSPIGGGFLSGKYRREGRGVTGEGRVAALRDGGNPVIERVTKREDNWRVLEAVRQVAAELGRPPAQVALAWVMGRPAVGSTLVGATRLEHLHAHLAGAAWLLPADAREALDRASAPEPTELDSFFGPRTQGRLSGGTLVRRSF